jgi:hypothetical protein
MRGRLSIIDVHIDVKGVKLERRHAPNPPREISEKGRPVRDALSLFDGRAGAR